ncbi:hypothetical protein, partial [Rhizobium leguminosarum]|uniref:hypothetical protein n=1 Tax=Rhizobium leguminosarum TaxID=384 RepID=UPI00197DF16F
MLANFEELILRIADPASRAHYHEAVRCYESGALRAAIVSAYIALCFDLIEKMKAMADLGDGRAKEEFGKIEEFNRQIRNGNVEVIKNVLEFERGLLELFHKDFEFLDNHEYSELVRLRDDRNRCAHPTFLDTGSAYSPSPELARLHIRNVGLYVLGQQPRHGRAAIASLKNLILSPFFPLVDNLAVERLRTSEFANAREPLINGIIDELLFGWPDPHSDFHHKNSALIALLAMVQIHRPASTERIKLAVRKLLKRPEEDAIHLGGYLVLTIADIGEDIDPGSVATLATWLQHLDDAHTSNLLSMAYENRTLRPHALARIATLQSQNFVGQQRVPPVEIIDRAYPSEQDRGILGAARGNVGSWRSMRTRSM